VRINGFGYVREVEIQGNYSISRDRAFMPAGLQNVFIIAPELMSGVLRNQNIILNRFPYQWIGMVP
jgi:hypothetical protein